MQKYPKILPTTLWNRSSSSKMPLSVKSWKNSMNAVSPSETPKVIQKLSAFFHKTGRRNPKGANMSMLKMISCSSLTDQWFHALIYPLKKSILKESVKFAPRLKEVRPSTTINQQHKRVAANICNIVMSFLP